MKSFVALALAASAMAKPMPQSSAPAGCKDTRDGSFVISVVNVTDTAKRGLETRQQSGILTLKLSGGDLTDQAGRTGYIASNHQFQFDKPVQDGALDTSGFSVCSNGTLALGGSAIWYQCYSGGFYNLYDESQGKQCNPIYIYAQTASGGQTGAVTQATDGQPAASTQVLPPVSQITDGQPQAPTGGVITQISDGQPQAPTGVPVSQISDGQPQVPTGVPVSQISDGQPQVPTGVPVSQISDGQPQVPTGGPVVSQISDGQPQVPTAAPPAPSVPGGPIITQISDGQPQVPTGAPIVSQISDGQPQVPTAAPPAPSVPGGPIVSQISDGQPQVPTAITTIPLAPVASGPSGNYSAPNTTAPVTFPGAASTYGVASAVGALAVGLVGVFALL